MARIRTPLPVKQLLATIDPNEFIPLLEKYKATDPQGHYLPWDQFKWKVEKGQNEEAAWLATKMARSAIKKDIPSLYGQDQQKYFHYCVPESLFAQLHYLDKVTGGGHGIADQPFFSTPDKDKYLVRTLMMEEAISSSQLEGATTTRKVAKDMLEKNRQPVNKSEQMIVNNYRLMKKVTACKDQPLSIPLILELHQIATYLAIDNQAIAGELRQTNDITISNAYNEVAHQPPNCVTLTARLTALCEFANACHDGKNATSFIHPLIKAIILHFMIGYIHPFGDGNGRTARALFYWFMLNSGYWLFEYVSISSLILQKRTDYDHAFIYTETDELDLTYFIYHQVGVITKAVDALQQYIEHKRDQYHQFINWLEQSPLATRLKRIQLELLHDAVKTPGKTFTAQQVAEAFDITENTARSYLNELALVDLLLATKETKGKRTIYIAPAGLADRLKG